MRMALVKYGWRMKRPLTKRYWWAFFFFAAEGMPTKPLMRTSVVLTSMGTSCASMRRPKMPTMRWRKFPVGRSSTTLPSERSVKAVSGCAKAMRSNSARILESSVWLDLRNFRRAGILKKRLRTQKFAPTGQAAGSWRTTREPSMLITVPRSFPSCRVRSSTCATAAIEARASPRNPMVQSEKRSVA